MAIRPTFMGFETATRGLRANQKSLDIVANNTSNIGVTGYTRQRVDLVSMHQNSRNSLYSQNNTPLAGQGVGMRGVTQLRDAFLDRRFREEYSDVGKYNTTSAVLADLTSALDEISPSTMTTAMNNFQAGWKELQLKNEESTGSANLLANASQIVQIFQQMSSKLDNVWNQTSYNLELDVNKVNSILQNIAQLNETIASNKFANMHNGTKPLELLDQRNVLLDQLAEYGNMTYKEEADGQVTVTMGDHQVISGDKYDQLAMRTNDNGDAHQTVSVFWGQSGKDVNFSSGAIRGNLDMLNGAGLSFKSNNGEVFSQGIIYYKDKIDQFAKTFATEFNSVIETVDSAGQPFNPPQYKKLFTFSDDEKFNASTIRVNSSWENDATYLYTDIRDKIEAGSSSNGYAAKASTLFTKSMDFGEYKGSIGDYITFYSVTKLANDKAYSDTRLEAVSNISDDILKQIQNVSGVSMEEEGVDMMMYKKAYDAVSRVFTTLDEMLDKLINGTGAVGR